MVDIPLRSPDFFGSKGPKGLECFGYRSEPGTSITIRLDPGKLGAIDLRQATEDYLCCARVPVYYNGDRIGRTYEELMQATHEIAGERVYSLSLEAQKNFDKCFPAIRGQYPKVVIKVSPIDTEEKSGVSGLSGVIMRYDICFDINPQWKERDQAYTVYGCVFPDEKRIFIRSNNINNGRYWDWYTARFKEEDLNSLASKFAQFPTCPTSTDQLGDVWLPFAKANTNLYLIWQSWVDFQQEAELSISLEEIGCPTMDNLSQCNQVSMVKGSYRGISVGKVLDGPRSNGLYALFLLDDKWKPVVNTGRSWILSVPLEIILSISSIFNKIDCNHNLEWEFRMSDWCWNMLPAWRQIRISQLGNWLWKEQKEFFAQIEQELHETLRGKNRQEQHLSILGRSHVYEDHRFALYKYYIAYLQDTYQMTIDYDAGQIVTLCKKVSEAPNNFFDLFPPMMFCKASTKQNRRYLCSADPNIRRGITVDHPFSAWMLENAEALNKHYPRQFQQITQCLCASEATRIIQICNSVREQLLRLPKRHAIGINSCPLLNLEDFWYWNEHD